MPAGRPRGSKNRLADQPPISAADFPRVFADGVASTYARLGGEQALYKWAMSDPGEFFKLLVRLLPQELILDAAVRVGDTPALLDVARRMAFVLAQAGLQVERLAPEADQLADTQRLPMFEYSPAPPEPLQPSASPASPAPPAEPPPVVDELGMHASQASDRALTRRNRAAITKPPGPPRRPSLY